MSARLAVIIQRRDMLIALSAAQRDEFATAAQRWERPLAIADIGISVGHAVCAHPALAALSLALLPRLRKPRLAQWLGRAWGAWQLYRALSSLWPSSRAG
jgi:hypothetical protein